MRETTALGAAIAAGLAVGIWRNFAELRDINRAGGAVFEPNVPKEKSAEMFGLWEKAVHMSKGWSSHGLPAADSTKVVEKKVAVQPALRVNGDNGEVVETGATVFGDLEGADEEDLLLELRKIEIQQRLKRIRAQKH
jgi:glycerol kinase